MRDVARELGIELREVVQLVMARRMRSVTKPNGYPLIPREEVERWRIAAATEVPGPHGP